MARSPLRFPFETEIGAHNALLNPFSRKFFRWNPLALHATHPVKEFSRLVSGGYQR
ncbi:hypothetical protein ALO36_102802 [Pseudomonas syringae pv. tomato]|uniref:Uncharacterized protein n=1 Tax=Pseudomonas syringae pv. maculicola TaxID=59511 RepID=A0A3M2YAY2_PSEYM|nr:hypothetical protein ALO36_102802 [Pseudomonas syringae pv. tomato]RML73106.1 hypothetical protein APX70_03934 [Pseudomonas syringae pv. maculicola]